MAIWDIMGMTEEEYIAHQAGCDAAEAEREAEIEAGLREASNLHYEEDEDGPDPLPGVRVVTEWPEG